MNSQQLQQLCRQFGGSCETLHDAPSNVLVYSVGGRNFAYFKTSEPERWRFSLRVSSERFLELTDMPGVKPARYMGRFHWVTIVRVEAFAEEYLRELLHDSYARACAGLTARKRRELGLPAG